MVIQKLFKYPVKSGAGFSLSSAFIDSIGLRGDREFLISTADGKFLTQRQYPEMGKLQFEVSETSDRLDITIQGASKTKFSFACQDIYQESHKSAVQIFDSQFFAYHLSVEIDQYLSELLKQKVTLTKYHSKSPRMVQKKSDISYETKMTDQGQLLITTESSRKCLEDFVGGEVAIERFRPNIHLHDSTLPAWVEDGWSKIQIGEVILQIVQPCSRCKIVTIDPVEFKVDRPDILEALKNKIRGVQPKAYFGVHAKVLQPGLVRVCDRVEVLG